MISFNVKVRKIEDSLGIQFPKEIIFNENLHLNDIVYIKIK